MGWWIIYGLGYVTCFACMIQSMFPNMRDDFAMFIFAILLTGISALLWPILAVLYIPYWVFKK